MNFSQSGIIIKTDLKPECVAFYKNILELNTLFESNFLTCFDCHGSYLMIEPLLNGDKSKQPLDFVIRFNVENVLAEQAALRKKGVESFYNKFDWGEILTFFDPAGTKLELKDSIGFDRQIQKFQESARG